MNGPQLTLWITPGAAPGDRRFALLRGDAAGLSPLVWSGTHAVDPGAIAAERAGLARGLERALRRPSARDRDALAEHGRLLFDLALPGPIKAALRAHGGGVLRVIADDAVHALPWVALHDGSGFLGLRWAIGELLGGGALPPETPASGTERLLIVADPAGDLPAARYEGEALAAGLARRDLALDLRLGTLRRADFLRLFSRFRLVHFAGHADPADDAPPGWRLADGRVDAAALRAISGGAAPSLVFANACRSAGWLGPALLQTGVRHVVGTAVDLPDLPGAEFASAFYGELRQGRSVGESLGAARVAAAEAGSLVWAAYRLFGDPASVYFRAQRATRRWAQGVRRGVVLAIRRPAGAATAEGMLDALDAWRAQVRDAVRSHGGRLLPGRSACARAVFGVPTSYENDAVRAARAALDLAQPGAVVVVEAGPLVSTGADVVGPAALAAEAACWRLSAGCYLLPGAHQRLGARARTAPAADDAQRLLGLATSTAESAPPLVGRSTELDALVATGDQALAGQVRAATLVGPAGIGKSRLVQAVEGRLGDRFQVLRGAGVPYGEGSPHAAPAAVLRALLEVSVDAPADAVNAALDRLIDALEADAPDQVLSIDDLLAGRAPRHQLAAQRPVLQAILGTGAGGSAGRAPAAFRMLIEAAARRRPLLIVWEDLHWMPEASLAVAEALLGELAGVPVFVLSTARPDLVDRAPSWFSGPDHQRLELGPLSGRAAEALLRQLLGDDDARLAALAARAEGNPLFLRELALQQAAGDDEVPATVEAVVQARLDRLPGPQREALSAAAVLGRTFWVGGVEALLGAPIGATLTALQQARFVVPDTESGLPGQVQWRFVHALQHEVVLRGLGRRGAAAWHGRAALWLLDEVPAGPARWRAVARHWSAAGDQARAARAWLEAAQADRLAHAPVEARRAVEQALAADDVAGALTPAARADAEQTAAALATVAGDFAAAARHLEAAIGLCPEPVARAERLRLRAEVDEARGEHAAARARLAEARALLVGVDTDAAEATRVLVERDEAWLLFLEGAYDDAAALLETLLPRACGDEVTGSLNNVLGVVRFRLGDFAGAEAAGRRAIAIAARMGDLAREAKYIVNMGIVAERRSGFEAAQEWYRRSLEMQVRLGDREGIARTYLNLGTLYGGWGKLDQAARYLEEAARMRERSGHSELAVALANLGEVRLIQGAFAAAAGYLERAIQLCTEGVGPGYLLPDAWRTLAELHLKQGRADAGIEAATEALTLALDSNDPQRTGVAQRVLGEAHVLAGDLAAARASLAAARATLEGLDEPLELGRSLAAQARLADAAEAAPLWARARALFESVGAEGDLRALDA